MPGKRWDDKELKQLRRQWDEVGDLQAIKIRGRTGNSIKRKLIREGHLKAKQAPREPWNSEEETLLAELVAQGMTASEIVDSGKIRRTKDSVAQKISRMKLLAGKKRSQMLRDCRRLSGEELDEFLEAIREHGETRHTQWFVWKYAVGRGKVKRALAETGHSVSWREAMEMPQTKARFVSRVSQASAKAWARRREELREKMVGRLREIRRELELNPKLGARDDRKQRLCTCCQGIWYASGDFFKPSVKRLPDGGRKVYLQRKCRICTSGQRGTTTAGRVNEQTVRKEWREELGNFQTQLVDSHPELFRNRESMRALRWEPFVQMLEQMTTPQILDLAEDVISIYMNSRANRVLDKIEETCFDGEPELHEDVWELDEVVRKPADARPQIVRKQKLMRAGREVAMRLYRVIRLPRYAKSLI